MCMEMLLTFNRAVIRSCSLNKILTRPNSNFSWLSFIFVLLLEIIRNKDRLGFSTQVWHHMMYCEVSFINCVEDEGC